VTKKKVLVVDDSACVRQQVSLALRQAGYEVVEAIDGADGLRKILGGDVAMAICDVNMPHLDGLQMLEAAQRGGSTVPVVMLTTEGQPAMIERARRGGARGWITKPFNAALLIAAVRKLAG